MILAIWGRTKTFKTALSMSFPKPLIVYDFDLGAYRAVPVHQEAYDQGLIDIREYPYPLQFQLPKVTGIVELWFEWLKDYTETLRDDSIQTIVIDTATQLYQLVRHCFLQRLQEVQIADAEKAGKPIESIKFRQRLQPVEYAEPYNRLDQIVYAAKAAKKHLVLIHNSRKEYQKVLGESMARATGAEELDGYRKTGEMVEMVVKMTRETGKLAVAEIEKSGLGVGMEGLVFENPTYDILIQAIERMQLVPLT